MKKTLNFYQFCDEFSDTYKNNFSYEGKIALFDYLEEYEESTGEELECDIVAFCCDYTEYENLEELQGQYNVKTMEELEDKTQVIPIEGTNRFIIQNY